MITVVHDKYNTRIGLYFKDQNNWFYSHRFLAKTQKERDRRRKLGLILFAFVVQSDDFIIIDRYKQQIMPFEK